MKHLMFSSTGFHQNLKWIKDLQESSLKILDLKHIVKVTGEVTQYTTIITYKI